MLRRQFNFLVVVEVAAMVVKVAKNLGLCHCSMDIVQEVLEVVEAEHSNSKEDEKYELFMIFLKLFITISNLPMCQVGEARNFHCLELVAYLCLEFVAADSTLVAELAAVALPK